MDDLDLDRELRSMLTATPSPDFVARVRGKIAEAPPPSMLAGLLKPAAAVVCLTTVLIVASLRPETTPERAGLEPSTTAVTAGLKPSPTPAPEPAGVVSTFRSARSAKIVKEPPLPEVIIAPEDLKAVQQFVSSASELTFVASFEETPSPSPWVMNDLAVPPIMIEPLDSAAAHNN